MRKLVASCSAILIAAAALAACGSSGSSKAAGNTTTSASNGGTPGVSVPPGNDALSKLVGDAAQQKFKVTYTGLGGTDLVYAQDGQGKSVYGPPEAQIFTSPSGSVSCGKTSAGPATCTALPSSYASASPFLGYFSTGKTYLNGLAGHGNKQTKTIAGRAADCVTFSASDFAGAAGVALGAALKGSATYCVDKSTGVLLEVTGTDASGHTSTAFTVTKFEEPTAADFTPPATIPGGG